MPTHPLESCSTVRRRALAWISAVAMLGLGGLLLALGQRLSVPGAVHGLLSFELAADSESMRLIFAAWGPEGRARAVLMTCVDYPFLVAYGTALSTLALLVRGASRFPAMARAAAWAATAAAFLDAFENGLGLVLLSGVPSLLAAPSMAACAVLKFCLVGAPLVWIPVGHFIPPALE